MIIRELGLCDYEPVWRQMSDFTDTRDEQTEDEIWLLQHKPVYTLGKNGRPEHVLNEADIPVVNSDRGGQVTYHGPGQIIAYVLMDLQRSRIGVRDLVTRLEASVIELLKDYSISAYSRADAPGVYVDDAKIAALGLRVRRGRSFHGLAFNVDMAMEPFSRIDPCGFTGLRVTQLHDFDPSVEIAQVQKQLARYLIDQINK